MATTSLYNQKGETVGTLELPAKLFSVPADPNVLYEVVTAQQTNRRAVLAHTKTRGEVRGGGRKPWKQKGTGRARQGSIRSPQWKGGGVVFGPRKTRVFDVKVNRKLRQKALAMALSDLLSTERLVAVDSLEFPEGKTRQVSNMLAVLPQAGRRTLLVVEPKNRLVSRAARNLSGVEVIPANALNVEEVLKAGRLVTSSSALETMKTLFASYGAS
ncbi:50S ribosomal protein L4 [Candidatus Uhrbacteria bacterium]|nr:50S ribosomal protein L4 [Candidatus Uhrbacteria bacterium]